MAKISGGRAYLDNNFQELLRVARQYKVLLEIESLYYDPAIPGNRARLDDFERLLRKAIVDSSAFQDQWGQVMLKALGVTHLNVFERLEKWSNMMIRH